MGRGVTVVFAAGERVKGTRLTVLGPSPVRSKHRLYRCACDCGATKDVRASFLGAGAVKSCGCMRRGQLAGAGRPIMVNPEAAARAKVASAEAAKRTARRRALDERDEAAEAPSGYCGKVARYLRPSVEAVAALAAAFGLPGPARGGEEVES